MNNYTIYSFNDWNKIIDYESDFDTVTLINSNGDKLIEYGYNEFTEEDFSRFKLSSKIKTT